MTTYHVRVVDDGESDRVAINMERIEWECLVHAAYERGLILLEEKEEWLRPLTDIEMAELARDPSWGKIVLRMKTVSCGHFAFDWLVECLACSNARRELVYGHVKHVVLSRVQ